MIEVRDLTKRFGGVEALGGISFTVRAGEVVGFLGPNGAGKTTTLRILAGVFPPSSGVVRIAGRDPLVEPLACRRAVGYFPEYAPFYPELGVAEYLGFVARLKRIPRARRRVGTLSKGYRQRVGLAQALCGDPPILVLDEPTIGLDPGQVDEIRALIGGLRGERTVLFSSHILSEVERLCERVIVIARGRLAGEGTPAELGERLAGAQRVWLRVDAPAGAAAAALRALATVHGVVPADGGFHVEGAGPDLARTVGEAMRAGGWAVLELSRETLDLEEVFRRLVTTR